ncbi:MAG: hypothetical protein GXP48_05845 [Acidobacteria bacterium]|nr:hypothetical protein [Acidobacteriota bacterium]
MDPGYRNARRTPDGITTWSTNYRLVTTQADAQVILRGAAGEPWRRMLEIESGRYPNAKRSFCTMPCNHRAEPACMASCPVDAITEREKDGIVLARPVVHIGSTICGFNLIREERTDLLAGGPCPGHRQQGGTAKDQNPHQPAGHEAEDQPEDGRCLVQGESDDVGSLNGLLGPAGAADVTRLCGAAQHRLR